MGRSSLGGSRRRRGGSRRARDSRGDGARGGRGLEFVSDSLESLDGCARFAVGANAVETALNLAAELLNNTLDIRHVVGAVVVSLGNLTNTSQKTGGGSSEGGTGKECKNGRSLHFDVGMCVCGKTGMSGIIKNQKCEAFCRARVQQQYADSSKVGWRK